MDVQINQTGTDDLAGDIPAGNTHRSRQAGANGGDFAVQDQQVGHGIELIGGVEDAAAGEEQRIHGWQRNAA